MTDNIKISTREEAGVSLEAVYSLCEDSFRQWTDFGIDLNLYSLERYKNIIRNATIFVAINTETGELLGTHSLQPNRKKKYVYGCFLAVSSKAKHMGIGTKMFQVEEEHVRKAGFHYFQETTSVKAFWSVNWHRKNGYRIIGYKRSPAKNTAFYIFRKQLTPSLFWSGPLAPITAYLHFLVSYTITCLCKTSSGELNILGKIAKKAVKKK
jgi:GNAT superfamily N-acetyltransferase